MTTQFVPYLRRIKVVIGPYQGWQGISDESRSIIFESDGTQNKLRIKFDVRKHIISTATPTVITIYNLSSETRESLQVEYIQVKLYVGWENHDYVLLYTGDLLNSYSVNDGPSIATNLFINSGFSSLHKSITLSTYEENTTVKNAVMDIASTLPGDINVSSKNVNIGTSKKFGSSGYTMEPSSISDNLDALSRIYGFSWFIDNKVFYAVEHGQSITKQGPLIGYKNKTLLSIQPILAGAIQKKKGVNISCLLNPWIVPAGTVTVDAYINPNLSDKYTVHTLQHIGDTFDNIWESNITSIVQVI